MKLMYSTCKFTIRAIRLVCTGSKPGNNVRYVCVQHAPQWHVYTSSTPFQHFKCMRKVHAGHVHINCAALYPEWILLAVQSMS